MNTNKGLVFSLVFMAASLISTLYFLCKKEDAAYTISGGANYHGVSALDFYVKWTSDKREAARSSESSLESLWHNPYSPYRDAPGPRPKKLTEKVQENLMIGLALGCVTLLAGFLVRAGIGQGDESGINSGNEHGDSMTHNSISRQRSSLKIRVIIGFSLACIVGHFLVDALAPTSVSIEPQTGFHWDRFLWDLRYSVPSLIGDLSMIILGQYFLRSARQIGHAVLIMGMVSLGLFAVSSFGYYATAPLLRTIIAILTFVPVAYFMTRLTQSSQAGVKTSSFRIVAATTATYAILLAIWIFLVEHRIPTSVATSDLKGFSNMAVLWHLRTVIQTIVSLLPWLVLLITAKGSLGCNQRPILKFMIFATIVLFLRIAFNAIQYNLSMEDSLRTYSNLTMAILCQLPLLVLIATVLQNELQSHTIPATTNAQQDSPQQISQS
jgi:hypothetical protein